MAVTLNARFFESYAVLNAGVVQAGVLLKVRPRGCGLAAEGQAQAWA
jgi:hypothetical protein